MARLFEVRPRTRQMKDGIEVTGIQFQTDTPGNLSSTLPVLKALDEMSKIPRESGCHVDIWNEGLEKRHPTTAKLFRESIAKALGLPIGSVRFIHEEKDK